MGNSFIWIPFLGLGMFAITRVLVKAPGRSLQSKFVAINPLAGKTKTQIIAAAGPPNSVSALPGGKSLLQWLATGYHISLIFNGEICEGVRHEFASR
jgi:hypothetical protein